MNTRMIKSKYNGITAHSSMFRLVKRKGRSSIQNATNKMMVEKLIHSYLEPHRGGVERRQSIAGRRKTLPFGHDL